MASHIRKRLGVWLRREPGIWLVVMGACGSVLVAGTLPELLKLIPGGKLTLVAFATLGLLAIALAWMASNIRTGFGVVIFLSTTPDDHSESSRMQGFVDQRRDRHLKLFFVNGDYLDPSPNHESRIGTARRVLHERLAEEAAWQSGVIDFYLRCDFPSAFDLARTTLARGPDGSMSFGGLGRIRINQFDHNTTTVDSDIIELEHHRWGLYPLTPTSREGIMITGHRLTESASPENGDMCAIIVNLFGDPATKAKARRAVAYGDSSTGYDVSDDDRCASEILIEASLNAGPARSHQAVVAAVLDEWNKFVESREDASRVQGRLLIRGPVAIVFALGALLPESVRLVPYVSR